MQQKIEMSGHVVQMIVAENFILPIHLRSTSYVPPDASRRKLIAHDSALAQHADSYLDPSTHLTSLPPGFTHF